MPARLLLLNKPYGVLCQFSREGPRATLADYVRVPGVYPAGRLDADSEGLVALTDDGALQAAIADPRHKLEKVYWVQVEGLPDAAQLERLRGGVALRDGPTRPARVRARMKRSSHGATHSAATKVSPMSSAICQERPRSRLTNRP